MFGRNWRPLLFAAALAAAFIAPATTATLDAQGHARLRGLRAEVRKQAPRRNEEPAYARGYADGYERGLTDGRSRDRYDPVGSREYRDGDNGYRGDYGSREAYRNNYRAGFRQGYEDGYRDGTR